MTTSIALLRAKAISLLGCTALLAASTVSATAQKPEARITAPVDNANRSTLTGSRPMLAQAANDAGRMPGTTQFQQMNIVFSRSAAQQSALDALVEAQQNPSSPQFHHWLSPEQFGAQFGAADADVAKVQAWLQSQGFSVGELSRDHTMITFSGAVAQIEAAFGTEMHYFATNGETHFGPAQDLSVPAALAPAVLSVGRLTDSKPHSHMRPMPAVSIKSNFTSSQSGNHFVQPGDVAVIYDINPAYSAGYTGSGQTIVVIGQSAVLPSDISNFQTAASVPVRPPTLTLIPGTGVSTVVSGDESESDLDLEYTSSIATGATINFVYTGNATNSGGAFYSLQYAIQNKLAPIISSSYGDCEIYLGTYYATYNAYLQQASSQGQTVISAAGDAGSTDCFPNTNLSTANRTTLAVDWPASSQYVTGMGGTEYTAAAVLSTNSTYFTAANGSDVIISAKSYIPEQVWNDDAPFVSTANPGGLSSGGGGVSIDTPQPSWQTGVPGIVAGSFRLVPDISLASSPNNAGYLYCSSDTATGITGSCSNGFRDATNTNLTLAGGTSFAAPIFAGMLAIINQKTNANYQGNINPTLYKLAGNASTYATAFHDITSGTNACTAGTSYCAGTGTTAYAATTGYDQATGLGSIDFYNLMQAWPVFVPATGSSTTVTPATLTPGQGVSDTISFKVASASSSVTTTPTGTIALSIDGTLTTTLTLSGGTASYIFSSNVTGAHVISAVYSGDSVFSTSTGTTTITVAVSTLATTTTTLAPATTPASVGVADAIAITVTGATPVPTGSVSISVDGVTAASVPLTAGASSSTTTFSYTPTTTGTHVIVATYLGDTANKSSNATLNLVTGTLGSFTLSASAATVTDGNTATQAITVTPAGGFTGAVNLSLTTTAAIANACYTVNSATVSGTTAATGTATIYTNAGNCPSGASALLKSGGTKHAEAVPQPLPGRSLPVGLAMAALLAVGFAGRKTRKLRGVIAVALLAVAGFAMSGCGSTSTAGAGISTLAPKGTTTVTVTGTDAATGLKTATTTFTLTIQ